MPFYFSRNYLNKKLQKNKINFYEAKPFPHCIIDNFLPDDIATSISETFPKPEEKGWNLDSPGAAPSTKNRFIEKLQCHNEEFFPDNIRHLLLQFNSSIFIRFLEELTTIPHLIPDISFNACGLHSTGRGGRLMIHADGNRYYKRNLLHQQLNVIYFCTNNWQEEWGGHFELWDREKKSCVKRISPTFNRLILFDTNKYSFHGHPEPLKSPLGIRRNSLATYFYVKDRPNDKNYSGFQDLEWIRTNKEDKFSIEFLKYKLRRNIKKIIPEKLLNLRSSLLNKKK